MLPNPEIKEVTLQDYFSIIRKRLGIIVAFLIVIPTSVTIYAFTRQSVYRATVSILIEKIPPKVTKIEEVYQSTWWSEDYIQTQYKLLTSRTLSERAFEQLHLSTDPDFRNLKDPARKINSMISVEPVKNTTVLLLHVDDTDALRASSIANALAKAFIQQDIEIKNRAAKEAAVWLESQLSDIKSRLQEAEEALNEYVQKNRIVTTPDMEKKTQTLLENLKQQKADLETQVAEFSKRYKEKHPRMIALNAQLAEVNRKIEQETNNLLELNQKMVQYNLLKKEVDSNQGLYGSILSRAKETDITEKIELSSIRIVDPAKPADVPFKPQRRRIILTSILFSLFCGVGLSLFLEYLDSSVRTAEEVSLYLNLPFLGYITRVGREVKTTQERSLICFKSPKSIIAESYRAIRTSILFASPEDKPLRSILVTSSVPQEGKSFVASNLSIIFSQLNEKVVLLDLDMRRPVLHKNYNIEQKAGLSNFLTGTANLNDIIKPSPVSGLSLITSGDIPPNPSELLSSGKIHSLFEELISQFDRIIVDAPPILSAADASLIANIINGVVFVIKGGYTRIDALRQARAKAQEAKGNIIGVIINNLEPEKEDRYYYYHYYESQEEKDKTAEKPEII